LVRNSPIDNAVTINLDGQDHNLMLGANEQRIIQLPVAHQRPYALVRIAARHGFRPSQALPGNRDQRYLGCWVERR
jgi:hypothetical protein